MDTSDTKGGTSSSPTRPEPQKPATYEPPAVAWEELFDPVAQTVSDCLRNPTLPGC